MKICLFVILLFLPSLSVKTQDEEVNYDESEPVEEIEQNTEVVNEEESPPAVTSNVLVVARGSGNIPPFEWENENGVQGFHIDLVREMGKRLGYDIQFESIPWKRALIKMKVKSVDAITYVSKSVDREDFIYFFEGNTLSKTNVHFFTIDKFEKREKKRFWDIRSFMDFKEWFYGPPPRKINSINLNRSIYSYKAFKIGLQNGYFYGDEVENVEGLNKIMSSSIYDLKNSLLSGEADIGLVDIDYFTALFKEEDFFKRVRFSSDPFYISINYLGFSKKPKNLEIAKKFSEELIEYKKTPEYRQLIKKYGIKLD